MAEEQKVGPNATYVGEDAQSVTMQGVTFERNKAVNVVDLLGEEKGKRVLQKLAGNQFFKVDGGPDHAKAKKLREEQEGKLRDERQRMRDARDNRDLQERKDRRANQLGKAALPPDDFKGPERETLESPRTPKK